MNVISRRLEGTLGHCTISRVRGVKLPNQRCLSAQTPPLARHTRRLPAVLAPRVLEDTAVYGETLLDRRRCTPRLLRMRGRPLVLILENGVRWLLSLEKCPTTNSIGHPIRRGLRVIRRSWCLRSLRCPCTPWTCRYCLQRHRLCYSNTPVPGLRILRIRRPLVLRRLQGHHHGSVSRVMGVRSGLMLCSSSTGRLPVHEEARTPHPLLPINR
jgi:hypothetical protein